MSMDAVRAVVDEALGQLCCAEDSVESLHVYVAGAVTNEIEANLKSLFAEYFPSADVEIQTDLVAAARAACGHAPGVAAILGTGSNSCQWDGEKIVKKVAAGGFILGDEGSAAALGKLFLADYIKGLVPAEIAEDFASRYPSDYATIVANVYRSQAPSAYLGGFAPFIMEYYSHPYIKEFVDGNFRSFIRRSLKQYDTEGGPVGVVGGFAYALKDIFLQIASEEGISVSRIIKAPIEGLIEYHS
jgi:N-acetylglucosamine kinase-like BadF-type ATPase